MNKTYYKTATLHLIIRSIDRHWRAARCIGTVYHIYELVAH